MHVDGGAFAQTFLYPLSAHRYRAQRRRAGQPVVDARAYVIRNGRLDPEWAAVERRTLGIAGRAIATMIAAAGFNDVVRIYDITQRDGIDYNLAFIGPDFTRCCRRLSSRPTCAPSSTTATSGRCAATTGRRGRRSSDRPRDRLQLCLQCG